MNTFVAVFACLVACAVAGGYGGYGLGGGYGLAGGYGLGGYGGYGHGIGVAKAVVAPVAVAKAVGHSSQYEVRGHSGVVGYAARPVAVGYGHGYGHGGLALGGYGGGYGHGYHG